MCARELPRSQGPLPAIEALEPRLLLSVFPAVFEVGTPHNTELTAQDLTAELAEFAPGEGSWGIEVAGAVEPGTPDHFRIDVSEAAFLRLSMTWTGLGTVARSYSSRADPIFVDAGTQYLFVSADHLPDPSSYRWLITVTYPQSESLATLAYDAPTRAVELDLDVSKGDPCDAYWLPKEAPGETGYHYMYLGSNATDIFTSQPGHEPYSWHFWSEDWLEGSLGYATYRISTDQDLTEPNDDPTQAIDVTSYIQAVGWKYGQRELTHYLHLTSSQQSGTPDWFKVTLDHPFLNSSLLQ